jgi:hypothetical protein
MADWGSFPMATAIVKIILARPSLMPREPIADWNARFFVIRGKGAVR